MSSAAELRFRVQAPNSLSRATAIVALDTLAEAFVRQLAGQDWNRASFFTSSDPRTAHVDADDGWIWSLDGERTNLAAQVDQSDQVIMVAGPGGRAAAASAIGRECSRKRVMTTGLIVGAAEASDAEVSKTLAQLRPWSLMVVMANADEYVGDMMIALRV
jgi:hypothetical protein